RPASKLSSRSFLFTAAARRARLPHPGGKWCRFFCHKIITQNEQKLFATEVIARLVGSILCNTNERGNFMSQPSDPGMPISSLLKALAGGEGPLRQEAVRALNLLGASAVPDLIGAMKDDDWDVRNQAVTSLGDIGPEARAGVPALIDALQEEDKYFRSNAAIALGKIGRESRAAVPALTRALKDKEEDVRREAAAALGRMGPEARAAGADLID